HGTPEGGWANEIRPEVCVHTLIAVFTDEGVTGWGSTFTSDALVHGALGVLEPLYRGENPLEPERVSEKLHANTFWMGRGGSITHAISGIDIALWDILGKAAGQPVGRLLGGRYRERVRPYASVLMREPRALAEQLSGIRGQGFRAFKIGWGPFGRQSFAMDEDIVQADVTKVGGIGEERRIAWMAEENGVRFIPHGWNTALGLAADLHLASASRKTDMVEYLMGSPFIDDLVTAPWKLDAEGMLATPDGAGLG